LHHIIAREIDRKSIFRTKEDKDLFLQRLKKLLEESDFNVYAWCIMENHFHLLLQTGTVPLSGTYFEITPGGMLVWSKKTKVTRDAFIFLGKQFLGKSLTDLGEFIGIKKSAASTAYQRGNDICMTLDLGNLLNSGKVKSD